MSIDSIEVFDELRQGTITLKYLEIIERLIKDFEKDDVIQIFRSLLFDHEICSQIVSNDKKIEGFYDRIIYIINNIELTESEQFNFSSHSIQNHLST